MNSSIQDNVDKHEQIADAYDDRHPEITNPIEQNRLARSLEFVRSLIESSSPLALDYGCGTGNVTRHLVRIGFNVEAADVTPKFVDMVTSRLATDAVRGRILNGVDLRECAADHFDAVTVYSVLHHIPDYLGALQEMVRVLKPGGLLFIDHEFGPEYWSPTSELLELRNRTHVPPSLLSYVQRLLSPSWYVKRYRKFRDPRYQEEGDIHVWPDDHIEWLNIHESLGDTVEVVRTTDYLYYQHHYPLQLFNDYKTRCSDLRELILRKR